MTEFEVSVTVEARDRAERIRTALGVSWQLIKEAYLARDWISLGYDSWDHYCSSEFGESRIKLPREERQEVVSSMREIGMSTRAIGTAIGASEATVRRELATASNDAVEPAEVTGVNGKTYTPKPRLAPVPDPPEKPAEAPIPEPESALSFDDEPDDGTPEWEEVAHIPPARLKDVSRPTAVNIPQKELDELNNAPGTPLQEPTPEVYKPLDEEYHNPKEHFINLMSHLKKASKAIEDAIFTAKHIDSWDGGPLSGDLRELLDQLDAALNGGSFDAELARLIEGEGK